MLTLFGTYIIAISVGAGCALINDLFFILSLKHHVLKRHEIVTLKQLNNLQIGLIIWIILAEITFFSVQIQNFSIGQIVGASVAKLLIELTLLFCVMSIKYIQLPTLIRHQHAYHHLSDSFVEHSNGLVGTSVTSLISWFFIILVTSASFGPIVADFGFGNTILTYIVSVIIASWFFIILKNKILHRKH